MIVQMKRDETWILFQLDALQYVTDLFWIIAIPNLKLVVSIVRDTIQLFPQTGAVDQQLCLGVLLVDSSLAQGTCVLVYL